MLFRLEVAVLALGLVCGMMEVPGAQAVQGDKTGHLLVLKMFDPVEMLTHYPA